jgi:putative methyltransferase (TIGR04325 family)
MGDQINAEDAVVEPGREQSTNSQAKKLVRQILPPFVLAVLRRLNRSDAQPVLKYAPEGWATLSPDRENGWDRDVVVRAEAAKWDEFRRNLESTGPLGFSHEHTDLTATRNVYFHNVHLTFAYVLTLAARMKNELSVLDWGGGLGHYYLLGRAVLPDVRLQFDCREVPLMCEQGKQLCPEVTFYSDDACLNKSYDVVMVNGSLGYFKEWKAVLARLCDSVGKYLFLTRVLTVRRSPSFVVLQRTEVYGYNSDMLTQVLNEEEVLGIVRNRGLRLVREFVVGEGPTIVGAPEESRDCGWLFERAPSRPLPYD